MPEFPEITACAHRLETGKGSGIALGEYKALTFSLMISPLCFSEGTTKRPYSNLSVDTSDFNLSSPSSTYPNPTWVTLGHTAWPPEHWLKRTKDEKNKHWAYLLDNAYMTPGSLLVAIRGKQMVIAAGKHAMTIAFGLESHIIGMTPPLYFKIVGNDIAGSNKDPEKAERIRTFLIPDECIVKNSSPFRPRTIKIFAAFVSAKWVWVLCDFAGFVKMHIKSRDLEWTPDDLRVGSPIRTNLFSVFKGGPDWILERIQAQANLRLWRQAVLREYQLWQEKADRMKTAYDERCCKYKSRIKVTNFFEVLQEDAATTKKKKEKLSNTRIKITPLVVHVPEEPIYPKAPCRPIIREICTNSLGAFSGPGRHTANDLLFTMAIFPGTPSHHICSSDALFNKLEQSIYNYLLQFTTEAYFKEVTGYNYIENPFAFDEISNKNYMNHYILVFRRTRAKLSLDSDLYKTYLEQGLLDPEHTISDDYVRSPKLKSCNQGDRGKKLPKNYVMLPVQLYGSPLFAYSIIKARFPAAWGPMAQAKTVTKDVNAFGYQTTIGPPQFQENVANRPSQLTTTSGRGKKVKAGARGRPSTIGGTAKSRKAAQKRGRTAAAPSSDIPAATTDDEMGDNEEYDDSEPVLSTETEQAAKTLKRKRKHSKLPEASELPKAKKQRIVVPQKHMKQLTLKGKTVEPVDPEEEERRADNPGDADAYGDTSGFTAELPFEVPLSGHTGQPSLSRRQLTFAKDAKNLFKATFIYDILQAAKKKVASPEELWHPSGQNPHSFVTRYKLLHRKALPRGEKAVDIPRAPARQLEEPEGVLTVARAYLIVKDPQNPALYLPYLVGTGAVESDLKIAEYCCRQKEKPKLPTCITDSRRRM